MAWLTHPAGGVRPLWAEHNGYDWEHGAMYLHPHHPMRHQYRIDTLAGTILWHSRPLPTEVGDTVTFLGSK